MRYLFAVIANRTGEVLADHDEMAAIDSFNEKIEVAGQRIMAAGIAAPNESVVFDFRGTSDSITNGPIVDSDLFMSGYKVNKNTFVVPVDWKVDASLLRAMVKARLAE